MADLVGKLLLAAPSLEEAAFHRAVVLVIEHGPAGAMGLVLNKPTPLKLADVLAKTETEAGDDAGFEADEAVLLHQGGPCPGPLFVLHADGCLGDREPVPGLFLSNDGDVIRLLVREPPAAPLPWRAVGGYAGWGPGQLEGELGEGSWRIAEAPVDVLLNLDGDAGWLDLTRSAAREAVYEDLPDAAVPRDPRNN
ncbi:YqgE/AlgH family protein [Phycisphaera mikurensis]|uniref:Uncharacterized protein n=1 Tax=Phycisphaera mikurensis (strain NBRC 102666 / KCTC 22515 / FYK2301M01) TaxID=1142394 RepID=I0IEZ1_PHYMF|nr:YqgE/AlgH family protein [Phycisphaera mikurensis]MBB6441623.1 putative transcriptional regulator [Phycisphaera mikurensis]BAM03829.1 hypothetical protein PSMK_16700 [Phycisphaera mikurensis NBRC 102666]